ncbi:MAG: PD-(D/E)XK nuclease family protein, partial [Muribaculaceae bacterium]|nr:PD-(D/E)XK nuclease family protein [Muribaculaceae bacterium]
SMEEVLRGDYRSEQVFQLFTYAWLLGKILRKGYEDVRMEIYDVPRIFKNEENLPKIGGETIYSYKECADEFSQGIEDMIEGVFVDDRFEAAQDEQTCGMCRLRQLCRR